MTPKDCITTWEIDSGDSVLAEQRTLGPHRSDFFAQYQSADIDPARQLPLQTVSRFRLAQRPILWLTADRRDAVVDAAFSSSLTTVDLPRLKPGESVTVGQLTPAAAALPPREVLEFLVRSDVLRTYWHIGSEVCLLREWLRPEGYRALVQGVHTYFTSGRTREPFAFSFDLGRDGGLVVTGELAR